MIVETEWTGSKEVKEEVYDADGDEEMMGGGGCDCCAVEVTFVTAMVEGGSGGGGSESGGRVVEEDEEVASLKLPDDVEGEVELGIVVAAGLVADTVTVGVEAEVVSMIPEVSFLFLFRLPPR